MMMTISRTRWQEYGRWGACFAFIATVHVGVGAAALMARGDEGLAASAPVITIELAPVAAAPEKPPIDVAVGPQQVETLPELETPPPPPPDAVSIEPPKPPDKPRERKKTVTLTSAPAPTDKRAPVAAAPFPGAARDSNALSSWKSMLMATLERNKRYPSGARGDQGVAQLAFSVDRSGGVHNARILRSSGSSALDSETLALARRASPLPPPPPELRGGLIPIVVPIRYNTR